MCLEDRLSHFGKFFYRMNGGNLGDFVIAASELQLFDRLGLDYVMLDPRSKAEALASRFQLVYGGGGGWVDLWYDDTPVQELFRSPNLDKCIILPSSFHNVDSLVRLFDERFTVYCRERMSLAYCQSLNSRAQFLLHPDMAMSLDTSALGAGSLPECPSDGGIDEACRRVRDFLSRFGERSSVRFFRGDLERGVAPATGDFDLSLVFNRHGETVSRSAAEDAARIMLYTVGQFDLVETDRLHVMISARLTGKRVEAYDNSYGKIRAVYDYLFSRDSQCVLHA